MTSGHNVDFEMPYRSNSRARLVVRDRGWSASLYGQAPEIDPDRRRKRGKVRGHSRKAGRRCRDWLQSVDFQLPRWGYYWVTLTVGADVPDYEAWAGMRRRFLHTLSRSRRVVACHWVMEWQRRGAPHLHLLLYHPIGSPQWALDRWLRVVESTGAGPQGQHIEAMRDGNGLVRYLARHQGRGRAHYQRDLANLPAGWEVSGRTWGYFGAWRHHPVAEYGLSYRAYVILRRRWRKLARRAVRARGVAWWSPRQTPSVCQIARGLVVLDYSTGDLVTL